jgi:hypothetical protein
MRGFGIIKWIEAFFDFLILVVPPIIFILSTTLLIIQTVTYNINTGNFSQTNFTAQSNVLQYIRTNFDTAPINDIVLSTPAMGCPDSRYHAVPLYRWDGLIAGCYCAFEGKLLAQACSENSLTGCRYLRPMPVSTLSTWKDNIFCVKRLTNTIQNLDPNNYYLCPTGFTTCGMRLCIPNGEQCPITDIQVIPKSQTASLKASYYTTFSTYGGTHALIFAREYDRPAVVNLAVSPTDLPCLDPNQKPKQWKRYLLSVSQASGCGLYGTDTGNSAVIDQVAQDTFFFNQNDPALYYGDYPGFGSFLVDQIANLVMQKRIYVKPDAQCLDLDLSVLAHIDQMITSTRIFLIVIFAVLYSLEAIALITLIIYLFKVIKTREFRIWKFDILMNVEAVLLMAPFIVQGIWLINTRKYYLQLQSYYFEVVITQCLVDGNIIQLFKDLTKNLPQNILNTAVLSTTLLVITIVASSVLMGSYLFKGMLYSCRKRYYDYDDTHQDTQRFIELKELQKKYDRGHVIWNRQGKVDPFFDRKDSQVSDTYEAHKRHQAAAKNAKEDKKAKPATAGKIHRAAVQTTPASYEEDSDSDV